MIIFVQKELFRESILSDLFLFIEDLKFSLIFNEQLCNSTNRETLIII